MHATMQAYARRALFLCLLLLAVHPLSAQRNVVHTQPPRPAVGPHSDTADAQTYYSHGLAQLESDPREAAAAFYWAARLRPGWADPLYGRRVALLMSDPNRFLRYMEGNRGVLRSAEIRAIDSLHLRALTLDPFLYRKFERQMLSLYLNRVAEEYIRRLSPSSRVDRAEISYWIENYMRSAEPDLRAMDAYSRGRFADAVQYWEQAVRRARRKSWVRTELARVHYLAGNHQRALEEMQQAVEEAHSEDQRDLVFYYESKALLEQSIGQILEDRGEVAAAREAYGRALQEDLSYHPAHVRLARLAHAAGDTATALAEMDLAVQIDSANGALRYDYGLMLAQARQYLEASDQLRKAIELEPWFAAPYLLLAKLHDGSGMVDEAVRLYRQFAERAPRAHSERTWAQQRVAALEAGSAESPAQPEQP